jgi:hypothetical protein
MCEAFHAKGECMIVAAAIKTADGKVWSVPRPGRHDSVFKLIAKGIGYDIESQKAASEEETHRWLRYVSNHIQGFTTDAGDFLDRGTAFHHARACKQPFKLDRVCSSTGMPIPADQAIGSVLTSEDLW